MTVKLINMLVQIPLNVCRAVLPNESSCAVLATVYISMIIQAGCGNRTALIKLILYFLDYSMNIP